MLMPMLACVFVAQVPGPVLFGQPTSGAPSATAWRSEDAEASQLRGEHFGQRSLAVGDLDGDGVPDVAVSDYPRSDPENSGGRVWLFSGKTGAVLAEIRPRTAPRGWPARFGFALARAGDVDRDGVPDLAVAACGGSDFGDPRDAEREGYVRILSGRDRRVLRDLVTEHPGDGFGCALDAADVDGDGLPDLLIGAESKHTLRNESHVPGYAVLVSGKDGRELLRVVEPAGEWCWFGHSVAIVADADGDGRMDLAVGSPELEHSREASGCVRIFSSRDGHLVREIRGERGRELGWALARCGDLDGDRVGDLLASTSKGSVLGLSGRDGSIVLRIDEPSSDAFQFPEGATLCCPGDVDRDGVDDVLVGQEDVGAPECEHAARLYSGKTGRLLHAFSTGGNFASVGVGADFDADAVPDLLLGAWPSDRVRVVSLAKGELNLLGRPKGTGVPRPRGLHHELELGKALVPLGDLDGDGASELLVGAERGNENREAAWVLSTASARVLRVLPGTPQGNLGACWVAAPGDLDADGVADWAMAFQGGDSVELRFVSGKTGGVLQSVGLPAFLPWAWGSDQSLCAAGDVDHDQHADVAVLLLAPPEGPAGASELRIVSGKDARTLAAQQKGQGFAAVVCAGDLDSDGVPELVLARAAPAPEVLVWSTAKERALWSFVPPGCSGASVVTLAAGRDLDGDGAPDLVAAFTGGVEQDARVLACSPKAQKPLWSAAPPPEARHFGAALALLGDLDGDGRSEVLVGAPGWRYQDSSALVLRGNDGGLLRRHVLPAWQASGFGVRACAIADLDHDGVEDYVVAEECLECGSLAPAALRVYSGKSGAQLREWYAEDLERAR